jgi:hypothetical protein
VPVTPPLGTSSGAEAESAMVVQLHRLQTYDSAEVKRGASRGIYRREFRKVSQSSARIWWGTTGGTDLCASGIDKDGLAICLLPRWKAFRVSYCSVDGFIFSRDMWPLIYTQVNTMWAVKSYDSSTLAGTGHSNGCAGGLTGRITIGYTAGNVAINTRS